MTLMDLVLRALPLKVLGVEVTDPVLTLFGDNWGLSLMCPWEVRGGSSLTSWQAPGIEDDARELIGRSITSITASVDLIDPVFHLTGGIDIAVYADTDLDPWTLGLPDIVIIGRRG